MFILMIALLPLRGWMGEAMATEMAAVKFAAVKSVKMNAGAIDSHIQNIANADLPAVLSSCDTHTDQAVDQNSKVESCTHCQACHAAALIETVQAVDIHPHPNVMPHVFVAQQSSADRQLSQKPPIL